MEEARQHLFGKPAWKYRAVFGSEFIDAVIKHNYSLEQFIEVAAPVRHWTNKERNVLIVFDSEVMRNKFGELTELSLKETHEEFGIDLMERASERGYEKKK